MVSTKDEQLILNQSCSHIYVPPFIGLSRHVFWISCHTVADQTRVLSQKTHHQNLDLNKSAVVYFRKAASPDIVECLVVHDGDEDLAGCQQEHTHEPHARMASRIALSSLRASGMFWLYCECSMGTKY